MLDQAFRCGFIALVGRPNVGKSTLMNHLIGQKISITSQKAQTTRQKVVGVATDTTSQMIFVDTPGFQKRHLNAFNERLNRNVIEALAGVDVVLFVIEAAVFNAEDRQVLSLIPADLPVILVINKMDRVKNKASLTLFIEDIKKSHPFVDAVAVCARHRLNIDSINALLRPLLPVSDALYPPDMLTDRPSRFLAAEIIREKIFRFLGEELPYAITTEIESFSEEGALTRIHAAIIVDKDSQKGIVIGQNGERLKKISTEARLDMERLFDCKIFLRIHVKVKSGWAEDARFLQELGR